MEKQKTQLILFDAASPHSVFIQTVFTVMQDYLKISRVSCSGGHSFSKLLQQMSRSLFNLFAGNWVRGANSDFHSKKRKATARRKVDDKQ